jgi:hypothetical protein
MDAALARALAGMIVNAVEPDAVSIFSENCIFFKI